MGGLYFNGLGGFCALADKRYRIRNKKAAQDLKAGEAHAVLEA